MSPSLIPGAGERFDVVIVGGGIVGLAVAWRAREHGLSVALLEGDKLGRAASHVAAGMLAPVAEVEFGPAARRSLALGLRAAAAWPAFASELSSATDRKLSLHTGGTLLVARDDDEARELQRQLELRRSLQLRVSRLLPSEAREREPALAPTLRAALECPEDHSVDPRQVLAALRSACERAGVAMREHAPVEGLELDRGGKRVTGVRSAGGVRLQADDVVLAAGAWSHGLAAPLLGEAIPVRPVKGQIMRLRDPAGPGLLTRTVRYEGGYLLPRGDGRYVLGATVEERGFELTPTAGGVYELLRDARELVPGVTELELEEVSVGLRPGTPDNAPLIGRGPVEGLVLATGHHRNGILLAPLTAELTLGLLDRAARAEDHEELLGTCDPARFASGAAGAREAPLGAFAGARR
ncbi:MAG TPA: glycine oxidase ThiO [Solirubrobacteraceae bacterium]|nr:glycine oxidase ThiO [Solirubrobacteraceae bacterium]